MPASRAPVSVVRGEGYRMRFTEAQYVKAVESLNDGRGQLKPDARVCRICHDSGHQAWECGHNPLRAMAECEDVARMANELHDAMHEAEAAGTIGNADASPEGAMLDRVHTFLHHLIGVHSHMGHMVGPGGVVLPDGETT